MFLFAMDNEFVLASIHVLITTIKIKLERKKKLRRDYA